MPPHLRTLFRPEAQQGSSLIEFALTLPVLLLVLTGITTFGIAMNNYLILNEATSVGARQLAISRSQTLDPCNVVSSAVTAAAPTLTKASFTYAYSFNGVAYSGTTCSSANSSTGAPSNLKQGTPAVVTVTYPCNIVAYKYTFGPCTLTSQVTEVVQ